MPWTKEMADEWDDDATPVNPFVNTNKYDIKNTKAADDDWTGGGSTSNSKQDDGWNSGAAKNDGGWGNSSNAKKDDGWNTGSSAAKNDDGWGGGSSNNKSGGWGGGDSSNDKQNGFGGGRQQNDRRGPRKPDWICDGCTAKVFGSRDTCFKCNADKGDSKDAPADSGTSSFGGGNRPPRANNWICNSCSATVFGSRDSCFKCNEPKGDAKDAPPDSGNRSGGGRAKDWICDSCQAKVFGSRSTCFKCNADKGDSKDAPDDSGTNSFGGGNRGGRAKDWICDGCGAKVFGSKDTCFKCSAEKGDSKDAPDDGNTSGGGRERKAGDWDCVCGNKNFAFRTECQKCSEPKPETADGDKNEFQSEKPKEFYIPTELDDQELFKTGITTGINFDKYNDIPIKVTGQNKPSPIVDFQSSGLEPYLLDNIKKCNYTKPTPIQKNAIPIVLAGRDIMACAQTGSGKTAAFLLPILHTLLKDNRDLTIGSPHVLIISPTRELVSQIFNEARKFAQGSFLKCCQVYGGTAARHQSTKVAEKCHILVATPGRLQDFCEKGYIAFDAIRFVVLDEADRMLDMGFLPSVEKIMSNPTMVPPEKRQTLMFSATFPEDIQRLAGKFLRDYLFLTVGIVGGACTDVEQNFYQVTRYEKRTKLMDILNAEDPRGTMVFVETRRNADFLASFLSESKHPTTSIHGERLQRQREEALNDFKINKMKVLIATSVAARGLDIPNVRHVINYDLPKTIDDYVHRIGRTGRVGNQGKATSFYEAEENSAIADDLVKILKQANQPVPEFLLTGGAGGGGSNGAASKSNFGGRDVRGNYNRQSSVPAPHGGGGDDEEW